MIFTPTWVRPDGTDAIAPECRASIEAQTVKGEWVIGRNNPYPVPDHRNVLEQYRDARREFLAGGYDALLTVEHDNVLPPDAAEKLLNTHADLVYGVYKLRHGSRMVNTWKYISQTRPGATSLTFYPRELEQARQAGTWRVWGAGFGCTLIRRRVMERFDFHSGPGGQMCPDMPLAEDCWRAGLLSLARFDVEVGHLEAGQVLMPFGAPVGTVTEQFIVETWGGHTQWRCALCPWTSLRSEDDVLAHWKLRHEKKIGG